MTNDIINENIKRKQHISQTFNPVTGQGSTGSRTKVTITDFPQPVMYIPDDMAGVPLVRKLTELKCIKAFLKQQKIDDTQENRDKVVEQFIRIRCRHDFPFWAALFVFIKSKGGGDDIRFRLNYPQRRLITAFENMRTQGLPIRIILLKARQWGGSTATQIYMAWLQLIHKTGLNSLIVGHVKDASTEVKDMFDRMIRQYPTKMLFPPGTNVSQKQPVTAAVGKTGNIQRIIQRNCKIKIGTAEMPDSARGGDYNLVHLTEVGLWKTTDGKTPEQIVRSACSGILLQPYTMIVYESTANGTGNFFQREYDAAKAGLSQFKPLFIPWFQIEQYTLPFRTEQEMRHFAQQLYENRNSNNQPTDRKESGAYLWTLWQNGATLEAINWYIQERSKYTDHADMASEYPSDDIEAFAHSGARVFDRYKVNLLKPACRPPRLIGEVYAKADTGQDALTQLRFKQDPQGMLSVWTMPDTEGEETFTDRYLTVVDIGGRAGKSDWSVIAVFDRLYMAEGGKPAVAAQWYGHIDMDLLAWKAAQVAAFYDNSLLVIESNTLETHDKERQTGIEGDQSSFILNQIKDIYPNLYARRQSEEDIRQGAPRKYGFHTNVATKPMIISTLVKVIRETLYVERDQRCLDEYLTYERKKNGAYGAIPGKHDDLLMTRAIGLHICFFEMDIPKPVKKKKTIIQHNKAVSEATI